MKVKIVPDVIADKVSFLIEQGAVKVQLDLDPRDALDLSHDLAQEVAHLVEVRERIKELEDA